MGEQLYAVVVKRRVIKKTKSGKDRVSWERGFRAPSPEDDNSQALEDALATKLPEWEALDYLPTEAIDDLTNYERGHMLYGVMKWRQMFSPRQIYCHGVAIEVFRELFDEARAAGNVTELSKQVLSVWRGFTS